MTMAGAPQPRMWPSTLEARARDATAAAEAAARSSAEAEVKVEEVRKALRAEAGGAGGSLAGGAQVRASLSLGFAAALLTLRRDLGA